MPITKSAKKALRVDRRRQVINLAAKNKLKRAVKIFKKKPTAKNFQKATSLIAKSAKKGIIPKRRADRLKSRLSSSLH